MQIKLLESGDEKLLHDCALGVFDDPVDPTAKLIPPMPPAQGDRSRGVRRCAIPNRSSANSF